MSELDELQENEIADIARRLRVLEEQGSCQAVAARTRIDRDSLDRPYAALDVSNYEPIFSEDQLLAILLALLRLDKLQKPADDARTPEDYQAHVRKVAGDHVGPLPPAMQPALWVAESYAGVLEQLSTDRPSAQGKEKEDWDVFVAGARSRAIRMAGLLNSRSGLGLLHRFRQHFIYSELKAGPIELMQSLAPNEKLEVSFSETRTRTYEEVLEQETEVTRETSTEAKEQEELSERVMTTLATSSTVSLTANGSANWVFGSASGSTSSSLVDSSSTTQEQTVRRLQETTRKQAEQIRKKTRITTRLIETVEAASTTRHSVRNSSNTTLTYGLRKLYYEVDAKVQDLGPLLVWETLVRKPGRLLARGVFADEPTSELTDVEPMTKSFIFRSDSQADNKDVYDRTYVFNAAELLNLLDADQRAEVESGDLQCIRLQPLLTVIVAKDADAEVPAGNSAPTHVVLNPGAGQLVASCKIFQYSDKWSYATINVTATITPSRKKIAQAKKSENDELRKRRDAFLLQSNAFAQVPLREQLELEERKALLGAALAELTGPLGPQAGIDLEFLYQNVAECFDLRQMFYDADVAEWTQARRLNDNTQQDRTYWIHSKQSRPVAYGSGLGWALQPDADGARNTFLHAEWIRVCIPVRPGREYEAAGLLAAGGKISLSDRVVEQLLQDLAGFRDAERVVSKGRLGCEVVVTKCTGVDIDPRPWLRTHLLPSDLKWNDVYPIISQQHIVTPVKGFAYDVIDLHGQSSDDGRKQKPVGCRPENPAELN